RIADAAAQLAVDDAERIEDRAEIAHAAGRLVERPGDRACRVQQGADIEAAHKVLLLGDSIGVTSVRSGWAPAPRRPPKVSRRWRCRNSRCRGCCRSS